MRKDCWWNENAKSGKDTASLETTITPAESTKTEPPITGMLIQSDEAGEMLAGPAQWMYSVTKQESVPNANDFLIDELRPRYVSRVGPTAWEENPEDLEWSSGHRTSVHNDWQHDNLLAHTRRCQRGR